MNKSIFKKAEELVDKVVFQGSKEHKGYFVFNISKTPLITIASDGKKTYIESCTCKHHSVHQGMAERMENKLMLCSYSIAVIKSLK